jgi:hypothetical protein
LSIGHQTPDIRHPASGIKHLSPGIKHRTPNTQHPSPNIFVKLMKQTQITSTKNPFFALSYGYEGTGIRKGKRPFGLIFLEKGSSSENPT